MAVCWDVELWSRADTDQCFKGELCLHTLRMVAMRSSKMWVSNLLRLHGARFQRTSIPLLVHTWITFKLIAYDMFIFSWKQMKVIWYKVKIMKVHNPQLPTHTIQKAKKAWGIMQKYICNKQTQNFLQMFWVVKFCNKKRRSNIYCCLCLHKLAKFLLKNRHFPL
jgi:hypothetical protein